MCASHTGYCQPWKLTEALVSRVLLGVDHVDMKGLSLYPCQRSSLDFVAQGPQVNKDPHEAGHSKDLEISSQELDKEQTFL